MDLKDKAIDLVKSSIEPTAMVLSSVLLTGIAGQVVPGVVSGMLAYKQARQERNFMQFMHETSARSADIESRLIKLESNQLEWFKNIVFPIVSDYVFEEKQGEKIEYLVNGFVNAASGKVTSTDVLIHYYDTLSELTLMEIILLKNKSIWRDDSDEISDELHLSGEVGNSYSRLESKGLIQSKADSQTEEMVKAVSDILEYLSKPNRKLKSYRIKKSFLRTYQLTDYGRNFLRFFCDTEQ